MIALLLLAASLVVPIADKIDHALVFIEAGRQDLAAIELQKLLQQDVTPIERATILYDLATIKMRQNQYESALGLLDQIFAMLSIEELQKASPTLAVNVAYSKALLLVQTKHVEAAKVAIKEVEALLAPMQGKTEVTPLILTYLYEQLATTVQENERAQFLAKLESQNKQELIESFLVSLHEAKNRLFELYGYDNLSLYLANFLDAYRLQISSYIERITLVLHAPTNPESARMRDFLVQKLFSARNSLDAPLGLDSMLHALCKMIRVLHVIQAEGVDQDVDALLEERETVRKKYLEASSLLKPFWNDEVKRSDQFVLEALQYKESVISNPFQKALLGRLLERQELQFWKVLNSPLRETYPKLYEHPSALLFDGAIERLTAYRKVESAEKFETAQALLEEARTANNGQHKIIRSFALLLPKEAILFFLDALKEKRTREDLDLLITLLAAHPELNEAATFLKDAEDPMRYDVGLTLSWLRWKFSDATASQEVLLERVDAATMFQDTLLLKGETSWTLELQKQAVETIKELTEKSSIDAKRKKELIALFSEVITLTDQKNESHEIIKRLTRASEILKEGAPEQEKKEEHASRDLTSKSDLTMEMQKKTLQLSPETSIRLVQEMEREDASLFQKQKVQEVGTKPW